MIHLQLKNLLKLIESIFSNNKYEHYFNSLDKQILLIKIFYKSMCNNVILNNKIERKFN